MTSMARWPFGAALAALVLAHPSPSGDPRIVRPSAVVEKVFGDAQSTEGPAVAPDGSVYFSDITNPPTTGMQAGHIWRHDPATGRTTVFRSPSGMSNGILFDREGRMVVAEGANFGGRRVTRTDMATGKAVILAALFDGRPLNSPNDLTIDAAGRIYFTDPRYVGAEPVEQPVQGVYRIDPDGTVTLVIRDAGKPNGIALSPDQRTLYVSCHDDRTGRMALLAYDLSADGAATFRRVAIDFTGSLAPDGLEVDRGGNLWLTKMSRPYGIAVHSPDGKELAFIPVPEVPRNLAFGRGANRQMLYVTAGRSLYRVKVEQEGFDPFR